MPNDPRQTSWPAAFDPAGRDAVAPRWSDATRRRIALARRVFLLALLLLVGALWLAGTRYSLLAGRTRAGRSTAFVIDRRSGGPVLGAGDPFPERSSIQLGQRIGITCHRPAAPPAGPPQSHPFPGIAVTRDGRATANGFGTHIAVEYGLVALPLGLACLADFIFARRRRPYSRPGRCSACGYDLRLRPAGDAGPLPRVRRRASGSARRITTRCSGPATAVRCSARGRRDSPALERRVVRSPRARWRV